MDKERAYTQCIQKVYPNLGIETASLNQGGQFNDVIIINDTLIFRFAKYPTDIKTLQQEMIILKNIQDYVSLDIPNPIYHNLETQTIGEIFVGYPMIPGKTLWHEDFQAINSPATLEVMAVQLATFLKELHTIPINQVIPIDLPLADSQDDWVDMYKRIRDKLFPYMRPEVQDQVVNHFETYLDNPQVHAFEPALRHGDFGTGNLIFDPDNYSITGVIDFGSAGLGDAAIDFAALLAGFGEPFFSQCLKVYPEIEGMLERINFYYGTFALQEALFGMENGDTEAFESGIEEYV